MQTMIANASRYDWSSWAMGLMRSFFSGGGGAIGAPVGPMIADPGDFNLASGLHKVLFTMICGFVVGAVTGIGIFLKTHGAPDPIGVQAALADAATENVKAGQAIATAQDKAAALPAPTETK